MLERTDSLPGGRGGREGGGRGGREGGGREGGRQGGREGGREGGRGEMVENKELSHSPVP